MGSVSAGVFSMAWSPEQDMVVLATKENKLVLMTRDFDPITEMSMYPEEFGEGLPT